MMIKFPKPKIALLTCLILMLFISCDKELSGYGNYAIGVSSSSIKDYDVAVYVDGNLEGKFKIKALQQANFTNDCSDLMGERELDNIFLLPHVAEGTHRIELRNEDGIAKCGIDFFINSDACVTQSIVLE